MTVATPSKTKPEARVLVVDDESNIVELLSVSLKFQGFEVYTATNGAQALDRARDARPDAVILDVMMPGVDGLEVCRRMRAAGDKTPVLMLTARDAVDDRVLGLDEPVAFEPLQGGVDLPDVERPHLPRARLELFP